MNAGKCNGCPFRGVTRCTVRIDACIKPDIVKVWHYKKEQTQSDQGNLQL